MEKASAAWLTAIPDHTKDYIASFLKHPANLLSINKQWAERRTSASFCIEWWWNNTMWRPESTSFTNWVYLAHDPATHSPPFPVTTLTDPVLLTIIKRLHSLFSILRNDASFSEDLQVQAAVHDKYGDVDMLLLRSAWIEPFRAYWDSTPLASRSLLLSSHWSVSNFLIIIALQMAMHMELLALPTEMHNRGHDWREIREQYPNLAERQTPPADSILEMLAIHGHEALYKFILKESRPITRAFFRSEEYFQPHMPYLSDVTADWGVLCKVAVRKDWQWILEHVAQTTSLDSKFWLKVLAYAVNHANPRSVEIVLGVLRGLLWTRSELPCSGGSKDDLEQWFMLDYFPDEDEIVRLTVTLVRRLDIAS